MQKLEEPQFGHPCSIIFMTKRLRKIITIFYQQAT